MNPVKPTFKSEILPIMLLILMAALSFYFYAHFPDRVPTHWNFQGQPDSWSSRQFAAFGLPGIFIGIYLLMLVLPYLDPRKERYRQFRKVYHIIKNIIVALAVAIYLIAGINGLGYNLPVDIVIPALIGLLFIILGNYMAKIKSNWFVGIRTPWTLSSEEVWNKTHRFGGKVFILAGLLILVQPLLPGNWRGVIFAATIVLVLLGTIGYSFWLYRKEKNKNSQA